MENWEEGKVDLLEDHIKITHEGNPVPVALVAQIHGKIIVQFLENAHASPEEKEHVIHELDFYLNKHGPFNDLGFKDPWAYAIYHTSTTSNIYSKVHWDYFPKGFIGRVLG